MSLETPSRFDRERWLAVSPHLDRAMEMEPGDLAAWLAALRAEQPALAADLEMLLADRDAAGREGFLEPPDRELTPADHELESVGPYRLIRRLGDGGMGIVYLAEQTEPIRREVALKVIRPGLDSARVLARFASERQILAGMKHPGVAGIHEAGTTADGRPFVAMEYVPGESLTRFCDAHRLTVPQRLELFVQVCAAIQHAHQKGVIHRDIKPSNILVSLVDGRPLARVIDFGIAKAVQPTPGELLLTQTGMTLGTPEYMSPEQASPDAGEVDTRSDVYALGVVLYELLVGSRPFEARDLPRPTPLALLQIVRDKEPPKLTTRLIGARDSPAEVARRRGTDARRLVRLLDGELEWIALRALEKRPERRYASAAELAGDVERYLRGEPVLAGPPSTIYRLRKLARRHRVVVAALAVVAVAITAGGVISSLSLLRAVRAEGVAREHLRESLLTQAITLANSGELDRRARALDALERAAAIRPGLDARNAAIAALTGPGFHVLRRWSPSAQSIHNPRGRMLFVTWPDSTLRRYARGNADGSVTLHAIGDDLELLRLPQVAAPLPEYGAFSPDGASLAVRYESGDLHLWDLSSRTHRFVAAGARGYQFTPDSRHLVVTAAGQVLLVDLTTGEEIRRQLPGVNRAWPAVHPSGRWFVAPVMEEGRLEVRRTSDGGVERSVDMPPFGRRVLWSADGRTLVTTHADFSIRIWDWDALGAPRLILRSHRAEPAYLAIDPGGRWLASSGWDNRVFVFDLRDGRLLLNQTGSAVHAAADREAFVLVNREDWSLIEVEPPYGLDIVALHEAYKSPRHVAFDPRTRWLATAGRDGIRVLDLRSREVHRLIEDEIVMRVGFAAGADMLHAISRKHLLSWRLEEDPVAGRLRATSARRTPRPEPPRGTILSEQDRVAAGISDSGERWIIGGNDPGSGDRFWFLGHFDDPAIERLPGFVPGSSGPELSPDGQWAAWGNWQGRNAGVARRGAGAPPVELPVAGSAYVAFTPDSKRLAVGGSHELRCHEVGTWRLLYSIPRQPPRGQPATIAFTRDSRLTAFLSGDFVMLLDTATGREVATLPANQHSLAWPTFSPEGRFLAVASHDHAVLLWDIEKLRHRLREIGLDWESSAGARDS